MTMLNMPMKTPHTPDDTRGCDFVVMSFRRPSKSIFRMAQLCERFFMSKVCYNECYNKLTLIIICKYVSN